MTRQIAFALAALAVLVAATLAADRVVAAPTPPAVTYSEDAAVTSGTWYCVPLARDEQTATVVIAAVGDEPSQVRVQQFADGEATFEEEVRRIAPGETVELEVAGGEQPPATVVRWRGGPAVATWTLDVDSDERRGTSCASSPAPRWLLSGADTTVGSSARLYLFNPFETDAVARVAFATPEGREDMVSSENVSVPARSVVDVDIAELQPEQPDLGLIVEVEAGRVIASGVQKFGQPDLPDVELEGAELSDPTAPDGRTLLPATATDATSAAFAYAASGDVTTSWISVINPNRRPARVQVSVSDEIAGGIAGQEVVIGPGAIERIELDGASSSPSFGVRLQSTNDTTFAATAFMALTGDDTAVSAMPGVPEADPVSVQALAPEDATPELALYNPGEAPATLSVSIAGDVPDEWSQLELAPGAMELRSLDDVGAFGGPVVVTSDEPVLSTLRLSASDDRGRQLLTLPLVPANTWTGSSDAPVPVRDRTLETRPVDFPVQPDP
jgi:hypothetical protein